MRGEDGAAFVTARPEWAPPFDYRPARVAGRGAGAAAAGQATNTYAWAWIDEAAGTIRARSFVPEAGIAEDEATGSAALALCAKLGRPIVVHQGHGSVLRAGRRRRTRGGRRRVALDEMRDYPADDRVKPPPRSQSQSPHPPLVPAEVVGELVAQGPLDLPGEEGAIVAEVALQRVAIDDDPVLIAFARDAVAGVLTVRMDLGSEVGHHHGDLRQHLLEFVRQPVDRVGDQRLELIEVRRFGHAPRVGR